MRNFAASIAAIALAASGAYAQGNGKGNGQGNGNGGPPANAQKGPKADRGGGPPVRADRGNNSPAMRGGPPAVRGNAVNERGNGNGNSKVKPGKPSQGMVGGPPRGNGSNGIRGNDRSDGQIYFVDRGQNYGIFRDYDRRVVSLDGCPPGLAKKFNGCQPPGLAKKRAYQPSFFGYRGYGDAPFYYDDGFLLRLGRDGRISASIPLLGGALNIGNAWPAYYQPVEVRPYYQSYYGLQPNGYRYANNAIYRVDPETAAITAVAALLTGDDWTIGQPAPVGYSAYNVPYRYRDQYRDGPDGYYRYSDGYVYRLDPETRLVAAAIELALD